MFDKCFVTSWTEVPAASKTVGIEAVQCTIYMVRVLEESLWINFSWEFLPSPSLSKSANASLNSAVCSSVSWSAIVIVWKLILLELCQATLTMMQDAEKQNHLIKRRSYGTGLKGFYLVKPYAVSIKMKAAGLHFKVQSKLILKSILYCLCPCFDPSICFVCLGFQLLVVHGFERLKRDWTSDRCLAGRPRGEDGPMGRPALAEEKSTGDALEEAHMYQSGCSFIANISICNLDHSESRENRFSREAKPRYMISW